MPWVADEEVWTVNSPFNSRHSSGQIKKVHYLGADVVKALFNLEEVLAIFTPRCELGISKWMTQVCETQQLQATAKFLPKNWRGCWGPWEIFPFFCEGLRHQNTVAAYSSPSGSKNLRIWKGYDFIIFTAGGLCRVWPPDLTLLRRILRRLFSEIPRHAASMVRKKMSRWLEIGLDSAPTGAIIDDAKDLAAKPRTRAQPL